MTKSAPEVETPPRHSLQQQLWALTDEAQHESIREVFRHLKKSAQENLALGMIAYIKYGIRYPYENLLMSTLFESFVDLLEGNYQGALYVPTEFLTKTD